VGRIAGVRILLTPSWIASVAVIAVLGVPVVERVVPGTSTPIAVVVATLLGVLLGVSVLGHELGHCVVARLVGIDVIAVRLYLLGGVSELAAGPRTAGDEALVAAAGPAVSGLLAGVFWLALQPTTGGTVGWLILLLLALSNLIIAVFNLLPALPLDGGRVIRAGIWGLSGSRRAGTVAAAIGGYLLAAALVGWAVVLLVNGGSAALLPAGIAVAMAAFVVVGVISERGDPDPFDPTDPAWWPAGIPIGSVARPVVRLATDTPVQAALDASTAGAVILVQTDGIARGVLDEAAARSLAARDPAAPASLVARPITPAAIVLDGDDPDDLLARARAAVVDPFVLVDDAGTPIGVIAAADLLAVPQPNHRRSQKKTIGRKNG
jgi:Zn-dependent protease